LYSICSLLAAFSERSTMSSKSEAKEEKKLPLPSGHPQAGYLSPDLSGTDGVTVVPEPDEVVEKKLSKEERQQVVADANQAVIDHENEVAREDAKAAEEAAAKQQADVDKADKTNASPPAAKARTGL
jgi:hypothetical protein